MALKELLLAGIEKAGMKAVSQEEYEAFEAYKATLSENFISAQTSEGNTISQDSESWEVGSPIFVATEEGENVSLPVGEYEVEGVKLIVTEEGVLGEIVTEEAPEEEEEMSADYVKREELESFKTGLIEEVLNAVTELMKTEMSEETQEDEEEKKEELAATTITKEKKTTEQVDLSTLKPWERVLYNKNKNQ